MRKSKKWRFPGLGMRNLKTTLAVVVCMTVYAVFGRTMPFFACVAAVICMQDTVFNTVQLGFSRLLGSLIGGALGIGLLWVDAFGGHITLHILLAGLGVCLAIYLALLLGNPNACALAATVLLSVFLIDRGENQYLYALNRILETAFGIVVAIAINRLINPRVSKTDGSLSWSGKIARTDFEEGYTPKRTKDRSADPQPLQPSEAEESDSARRNREPPKNN